MKGRRLKKKGEDQGETNRDKWRGEGEKERKKERVRQRVRRSEWALCDQKACLFSWRLNSSGATLGLSALSSSRPHRLLIIPATGPESQKGAGPRRNQNKRPETFRTCRFKTRKTLFC